jgi:hypothetical protein
MEQAQHAGPATLLYMKLCNSSNQTPPFSLSNLRMHCTRASTPSHDMLCTQWRLIVCLLRCSQSTMSWHLPATVQQKACTCRVVQDEKIFSRGKRSEDMTNDCTNEYAAVAVLPQ